MMSVVVRNRTFTEQGLFGNIEILMTQLVSSLRSHLAHYLFYDFVSPFLFLGQLR